MWVAANKGKLSNERQLWKYRMCHQLVCPNKTHFMHFDLNIIIRGNHNKYLKLDDGSYLKWLVKTLLQ